MSVDRRPDSTKGAVEAEMLLAIATVKRRVQPDILIRVSTLETSEMATALTALLPYLDGT